VPLDDFDRADQVAAVVGDLYGEAERALQEKIARALAAGHESPRWADEKLAAVGPLRRAAQAIVRLLTGTADRDVRALVADVWRDGRANALSDLAELLAPGTPLGRSVRAAKRYVPNTGAMEALADAIVGELRGLHERITRGVVDTYRAVISTTVARVTTGANTRREATQAAWATFVDRGVTGFTDRSGRHWQLSSYAEMATRTVAARAAMQGRQDAQQDAGARLVVVSDHPQECALCRPWEGKVLALWGETGTVTEPHELTDEPVTVHVAATLAQAREAGLHHPNCRHAVTAYLPGVTRLRPAQPDPQGDAARQRQRAIERQIRAWKMRQAGALTPDAKRSAGGKVRAWQEKMRAHLAANPGLKRQTHREQPGAGNIPKGGSLIERVRPATPPDPRLSKLDQLDDVQLGDLFADLSQRPDPDQGHLSRVLDEMDRRAQPQTPGDPLADQDLRKLLDAELFDSWDQYREHPETVTRIEAELVRRDADRDLVDGLPEPDQVADTHPAAAETLAELDAWLAEQQAADDERARQAARELAIDGLVARGWEYRDAYAHVYGLDQDQLLRDERAALVDEQRRKGESREQAVRRLYGEWVQLAYMAAEDATRGFMLNQRGRAKGINPVTLFSGPAHVARAYASEELARWWEEHGRKTYTEFRAELLGRAADVAAAERIRLRGNGRDFGL
jgi:hypothetical protein